MRAKFDEQLALLNNMLVEMGANVQQAIADAIKALVEQNAGLAQKIIHSDDEIDKKEDDIESFCLKLILHQQPVATDLRLISSVLKLITDLERIGDHATDISEITLYLVEKPFIKDLEHIPQMAEATIRMVKESIEAFVTKDLKLARKVISYDDEVDNLFITVKNELIDIINKNAENGEQAIDLIMIAKYFERIGDHATNVAEWVIFAITGKRARHLKN